MGRRVAVCESGVGKEPLSSSSLPLLSAAGRSFERTESSSQFGSPRNFYEVGVRSGRTSSSTYHLMVVVVMTLMVTSVGGVEADVTIEQVNPCKAIVNGFMYNLEPLMRNDGLPRFVAEGDPHRWNYSFNPCLSFNLPADPHEGTGDQCHYVAVCQWRRTVAAGEYYSMGIQRSAKFTLLPLPIVESKQKSPPSSNSSRPESSSNSSRPDSRNVRRGGSGRSKTLSSQSSSWNETTRTYSAAIYSELSEDVRLAEQRSASVIIPPSVVDKASKNATGFVAERDMLREITPRTGRSVSPGLGVTFKGSDRKKRLRQRAAEITRSEEREEPLGSVKVRSIDKTEASNESEVELGQRIMRIDDGSDAKNEQKPDTLPRTALNDRGGVGINVSGETTDLQGSKEAEKNVVRTNEVQDGHLQPDVQQHVNSILKKRIPTIVFSGLRTKARKKVYVYLVCDYNRTRVDDAILQYINYPSPNKHLELRHRCCCPNGCIDNWLSPLVDNSTDEQQRSQARGSILTTAADSHHLNRSEALMGRSAAETKHPPLLDAMPDARPKYIWLILVINAAILVAAVFVAGVCCRKGGMSFVSTGPYGYVSTIHSSRWTMDSTDLDGRCDVTTVKVCSPDYRDYGSPGQQSRLPSLDNCVIPSLHLEVGQR